jgi:Brp/Blh family beta-carotene 15,15'-monooxygenase
MMGRTVLVLALAFGLCVCRLVSLALAEWVALGLMICAGIPHGSFDLRVAEAKWRGGVFSRSTILVCYLLSVFSMSALCVFFPSVGLALFLALSALHFSEGESDSNSRLGRAQGVLFGVGAILLPIGLHTDLAQGYVQYFIADSVFALLRGAIAGAAYVTALFMAFFLARQFFAPTQRTSADTVERLMCLCCWIMLPPLSGFAVWFIGRHSLNHLRVCKAMFAGSRFGIPLDFAAISVLAIIGLLPFATLFDFSQIEQLFAASICLIAGLTLPHMIVSHRMKDVVKKQATSPAIVRLS